jgi:hypothetical protein
MKTRHSGQKALGGATFTPQAEGHENKTMERRNHRPRYSRRRDRILKA